ncbi:MAG: GtrA family protein [Acidimicrobiia bacterium]|nr:GtrA family protein [Acidimicrobiia bacterium]
MTGVAVVERPERSLRGKLGGYTTVSVIAAVANLVAYGSWLRVTDLHPTVANIAAAAMVALPTFYVNRRWVWRLRDGGAGRQLLPYYLFTATNVTLSSTFAWFLAGRQASDAVLIAATFSVYATMWLLRFVFLDRFLFRRSRVGPPR